ncbi:MAG TPA: metal-dependent transcriptional regulator [Anaerolineales bacterium]|nr:metal-dependent transcriptional regulator [Anaerolineales bacterium]
MRKTLTHTIEHYLKTIYEIQTPHERASTNTLAEALEITPASVTGMIQKLAATTPPLVEYEKHRGVRLTLEGEEVALEILRHHRLLELFLHQILGYSWDKVHAEADRLEHVISEEFEAKIAEVLGDPSHDPHGDPIPQLDLSLPPASQKPLSELRPGQHAAIQRVRNSDPEFLCHLESLGLMPAVEVEVLDNSPFNGVLTIRVHGRTKDQVLGPRITSQIFVDLINHMHPG